MQQSRAEYVPDQRHQDQTVDARTVLEPVAASDRLALQTVQRAARSVQPDDSGQRRLLLRRRPVHRRAYNIILTPKYLHTRTCCYNMRTFTHTAKLAGTRIIKNCCFNVLR